MNELLLPIALQIAFFALFLAEIALPSGGLLGIAAAATGVGSWLMLINTGKPELLWVFGTADILLLPIFIWIGIKLLRLSPLINKRELTSAEGYQIKIEFPAEWVGREAIAYNTLRPAGSVTIDGRTIEALSDGPMIEAGECVIILSIDENKLMVTPKENRP